MSVSFLDRLVLWCRYCLLAEYKAYIECQDRVSEVYTDRRKWTQMVVQNIAHVGKFSSDRTIQQYADEIWNVKSCIVPKETKTSSTSSTTAPATKKASTDTKTARGVTKSAPARKVVSAKK